MDILQIENLTFRYPDVEINTLDKVSFSVKAGEFVVLCGESGCGKSTLLRMIKKGLEPYGEKSGDIIYSGVMQSELDKRVSTSEIGFVLQNPETQIVTDKVWHELAFGLENMGCDTSVIKRRVAEMASYFGIEDWFHKKTAELSGGQKQMLNLASVMVMQPKILLLDEPTAQLDPIAASNFIGTLQKLNQDMGLTIILVEHRLEEVFPIADRVLLMEKGRLVYADSPRAISSYIKRNPSHPIIAGIPSAMRIYNALESGAECPLTVKEGRTYLETNYANKIDILDNVNSADNEVNRKNKKEKILELKDVWFRYERELPDVLKGVSLSVYKGENLCILGGNGAGKTTTLAVMSGLLKAYRGKVLLCGRKISQYDEKELYHHNIAVLPQNPQDAFVGNTVEEDFMEICKAMECKKDEIPDKIKKVGEKLGIAHLLHMHPYDLSGGEQQKAALAKMLLLEPKILFLDEPTKGIDAYSKLVLSDILRKLKEESITIITVTHDVEFAAINGDRCAMFFDGEVVSVENPTDFFSGNNFYTTAANRIARDYYRKAILCEHVVELCRLNGRKEVMGNEAKT